MPYNQEKVNRDLVESDSSGSEFQKRLLELVKTRVKTSSDRMCQMHDSWDNNEYIYRGYRKMDKSDRDAMKDGEPNKIVVPITYAQTQTALSFLFSTFTQNENIFPLLGTGPEDSKFVFGMERDLAYQARRQKLSLRLYYWALDSLKHGFGVVKNEWGTESAKMRVQTQQPVGGMMNMLGAAFGRPMPTQLVETVQDVTTYEGNRLLNISPYAFYPDPSVSIARFQEGEFVFHEEDVARATLEAEEGKKYFGTAKIPKSISKDIFDQRSRRARGPFANSEQPSPTGYKGAGTEQTLCILTEGQLTLNPKHVRERYKIDIGDEDYPCKFLVSMANDQKIIRFEKWNYFHNEYGYSLFEFSPDHGSFFNAGLADTIYELQNIITFFLNSHIVNVRKIIANRFITDPDRVNMDDLKNGSLYIRTKGGTVDVAKVIQQVQTSDITRSHVEDMQTIMSITQLVTGISDNALGQYSAGRRSATEAKNVSAGSAARLKMHAMLMWMQGIEPLGRQWIANTRQWRTREIYANIVGDEIIDAPYEKVILADPAKLSGGYDFATFDPNMPLDRQFQAGMLKDLFSMLIAKPESMQLLNKNPMTLVEHIAKLYGIRNLRDFDMQPLQAQAAAAQAPQVQVVPDAQAKQLADQGAEQIDITGADVLRQLQGQ
jgi:hypothetical protein